VNAGKVKGIIEKINADGTANIRTSKGKVIKAGGEIFFR